MALLFWILPTLPEVSPLALPISPMTVVKRIRSYCRISSKWLAVSPTALLPEICPLRRLKPFCWRGLFPWWWEENAT